MNTHPNGFQPKQHDDSLTMKSQLNGLRPFVLQLGVVLTVLLLPLVCGAQSASLSGTVNYGGRQRGDVWVLATTNAATPTNLVGSYMVQATVSPVIGAFTSAAFTLTNLPTSINYWIFAWRDSDANGVADIAEAKSAFEANPVFLTNDFTNATLVLGDPDHNSTGVPDWWEKFHGIVPSFGDGTDGAFVVNAGQTNFTDTVRTSVTGNNPAGSSVLSVASTNGFRTNDIVLIIVMQDPNPELNQNIAGRCEAGRIQALSNNTLVLTQPLSSSFPATGNQRIQVLRVPQYSAVTVNGTLKCSPWNGTNGGVLAFLCQNDMTLGAGGIIDASGTGFRGGFGVPSGGDYEYGIAGEGTTAWSLGRATNTISVVQGGGGAGKGADGSGGGGGYGKAGNNGAAQLLPNSDYGRGAAEFGDTNLTRLFAGGGGGGAGSHSANRPGVAGGAGGGVVLIAASNATGSGTIACRGLNGANGVKSTTDLNSGAGGGGGAGGSLLLIGSFGTNLQFSSTGGLGGSKAGGSNGHNGGGGGHGRIRTAPYERTFSTFFFRDADGDGLRDDLEYQADTNPLAPDTDSDGLPDGWEVRYGLIPNNPTDAGQYSSDGQLTFFQKYLYGLNPLTSDSDGDGLTDYDESFLQGTSPLSTDTDGDGMPDLWELQYGLNPRVNDSDLDRDLDGLTNFQEYQFNQTNVQGAVLSPTSRWSSTNGLTDYESVTGNRNVSYSYDRNDRLMGAQYGNGLVLYWQYDGNGNILRQLTATQDTSALPFVWRLMNNLTNETSSNRDYADADADGWSNFQEWQAGSKPTSSVSQPDLLGLPGTNIATLAMPFTPSNFVVGVGQLNGTGADEIVVGADGTPGTTTNFLLILSQHFNSWITRRVDIGPFGITSISVGQLTNRPSVGIYLGLRDASGAGRVAEVTENTTNWTVNTIATSTNNAAFVLGLRSTTDLLVSLATTNAPMGTLFSLGFGTNWNLGILDTNLSTRGLGTIGSSKATESSFLGIRLLDSGGIGLGRVQIPKPTNAVFNAATGRWYWRTPERSSWTAAQAYARSLGGELATVTDGTLNSLLLNQLVLSAPDSSCWIGLFRNNCSSAWQWSSGGSVGYSNWRSGEPNCAGGAENHAHITSTGQWNDGPDTYSVTAIIEMTPQVYDLISTPPVTLFEPAANNRLNWRGLSLRSGFPRVAFTNHASVFYACLDDRNGNSQMDEGDEFVMAEYQLVGSSNSTPTLLKRRLQDNGASSYGLALVNYLNRTSPVLFTGEPDGRIFAWAATGAMTPLSNQVFSGYHGGKAWHALAGVQIPQQGEGLVGLRVDPSALNSCSIIYWEPRIEMPKVPDLAQTAPLCVVLPGTNILGPLAQVPIRLWDAEGNAGVPSVEYKIAGTTEWKSAELLLLDGSPYSSKTFVAASPIGVNHSLVWNVLANLAPGIQTNVLLRARARDLTLFGQWSTGTTFQVDTTSPANPDTDGDGLPDAWEQQYFGGIAQDHATDFDHDGFSNLAEYVADTNPTNPASHLRLTSIQSDPSGVILNWQGGVQATQYVQRLGTLDSTQWLNLWTGFPPTSVSGSWQGPRPTNAVEYYRIKVER